MQNIGKQFNFVNNWAVGGTTIEIYIKAIFNSHRVALINLRNSIMSCQTSANVIT